MDIKRKIEIAEQSIRSISTHDDADLALRVAALHRLQDTIAAECVAAEQRVQIKVAAMVGGGEGG